MSALSETVEVLLTRFLSSLAREGTTLSEAEIATLRSTAAAEERGFLASFSKDAASEDAAAAARFRTALRGALPGSEAAFNAFAAAQREELASLAGVLRPGARTRPVAAPAELPAAAETQALRDFRLRHLGDQSRLLKAERLTEVQQGYMQRFLARPDMTIEKAQAELQDLRLLYDQMKGFSGTQRRNIEMKLLDPKIDLNALSVRPKTS
jgi:hypothetical protein